ncbi:MAG: adenylosuccinate lyase [Halodesulfurarchaeum sp.]
MPPERGPLFAISPLDGRYEGVTEPLVAYASEAGLMRARVRVEVEYVIALSDIEPVSLSLDEEARETLRSLYEDFDDADAELIKAIEREGARGYPATNHDVKAIEYFLREGSPENVHPWIHFGLTSEDVTNLAYRLLIRDAVTEVLLPDVSALADALVSMAHAHADVPMLGRTHGQPATPTTFGKELAVFAARLRTGTADVRRAVDHLAGKLGGATGTLAAHETAIPEVDWRAFSRRFVEDLGFEHCEPTTQVNPGDDLAALFDALRRTNQVLIDLDRDAWRYVSDGYLGQEATAGETGSSTMPHKVNPIDFENSEGNLSKANADLAFLGSAITTSRLQRDLSDSTVKRNVGSALAHCHLGYIKLGEGLDKVVPNEVSMAADLEAHPEVLAEAIQTVLRSEGDPDAYERVKEATRGQEVTLDSLRELVQDLDLPPDARERLLELTPSTYLGIAEALARDVE